jgi:hypothetical protein
MAYREPPDRREVGGDMRASFALLLAAITLLQGACGVACTLLPCPGLTVQVAGVIPTAYTVTLSSVNEPSVSMTCSVAAPCPSNLVHFWGHAPDIATVSVVWADRSVAVTAQPEYGTVYPNGQQCNACRAATITVTLA